jgi:ferric-dicitrate binding protein FerR (iron transport regulator)
MALSHAKLFSLLAAQALDALKGAEAGQLSRHLASGCPRCEAELKRLRAAAALLSLAPLPLSPPRALRDRLLAAVQNPALELTRSSGFVRSTDGRIETGSGAGAEFRVPGQILVSMMQKSLLTLRRGAQGLEMLIEKGAALVQVNPGTPFSAQLPLGLVRVKGTYFFVESRGQKNSYVCLCEGWVGLSAPGLSTELKTQDHQAFELSLRRGKTLLRPATTDHAEPDMGPIG